MTAKSMAIKGQQAFDPISAGDAVRRPRRERPGGLSSENGGEKVGHGSGGMSPLRAA